MPEIRPVQSHDLPFLWDMLWEGAAVDAGMRALGKDAALDRPENRTYLDGWGRPGDAGVVALGDAEQRLGAAWYRRFPNEARGYGFVAPDVPELAIGVVATARGRGVGGALLDALLALARERGERALSLAVDRRNPARALYQRHGFRDLEGSDRGDASVTMMAMLQDVRNRAAPRCPGQRSAVSTGSWCQWPPTESVPWNAAEMVSRAVNSLNLISEARQDGHAGAGFELPLRWQRRTDGEEAR